MVGATLAVVLATWAVCVHGAAIKETEQQEQERTTPSNCKNVKFSVYGEAQNRDVTGIPLDDPAAFLQAVQADTFPRILVKGSQTLAGTFCLPTRKNSNNDKLQVLFHSITSNRDSWSAQGGTGLGFTPYKPEIYSYVGFMNAIGYPTLAIDRLGNGQSSHPDPVLVVQGPYENELYHSLAVQIKKGNTTQLPKAYSTLTWVSNSYGSELGTSQARAYPNDYSTYILTGFSKSVQPSLPGVSLQNPLPAAVVDPARFGTLNPGYLTASIEQARTNSFFGDPKVVLFEATNAHLFFTREDVVSVGQFVTTYIGPVVAPAFKGRVLVLTGEQDQAFCGPGSSAINPTTSCGPLLAQTKSLFPVANYNYQSINRTGHAIQLHKTAPLTYGVAAAFLAGGSFSGNPPL